MYALGIGDTIINSEMVIIGDYIGAAESFEAWQQNADEITTEFQQVRSLRSELSHVLVKLLLDVIFVRHTNK